MPFRITPTSAPLGAIVWGLDVDGISADEATELYQAFLTYGVLAFRGSTLDQRQHVALSAVFGENVMHPITITIDMQEPAIIVMSANGGEAADADDPGADELVGVIPWHSDMSYTEVPTRGAMLRAVTLPDEGGDTAFVDTARVYRLLPDAMKAKIRDLRILHSYNKANPAQTMVKADQDLFPDVIHPLVYEHPELGLPVLNISPNSAKAILGLPEGEARELLDHLIAFACRDEEAYVHVWEPGDLLLWDNWRTIHQACGHPKRCKRVVHRTTLHSDLKLGEFVSA
jgi:taurine dioxygenase